LIVNDRLLADPPILSPSLAMAMFTKDSQSQDKSDTTKQGSGAAGANEAALSIIAFGMKIHGDIDTSGVIKVEGAVEGTIRGARQVLVGRQGEVKGDVHAKEVVIGGKVDGTVHAGERVEIQGSSSVNGDIYTKSIVVLEGGKINGTVRMDEAAKSNPNPVRTDTKPLPVPPVAVVR
jgi:cytoskeletal protein CcmA (bactofilin family)